MFFVGPKQRARSLCEGKNPFKPADVISTRPRLEQDSEFIDHLRNGTLHKYTSRACVSADRPGAQDMLSNPYTIREIVLCNDKMIGYRSVSRDSHAETLAGSYDCIFVNSIRIAPDYQNKGIGSLLMNEIIDKATRNGLPVALNVMDNNLDAQRLYRRLGFKRAIAVGQTDTVLMIRFAGMPEHQASQNQTLLFNAGLCL